MYKIMSIFYDKNADDENIIWIVDWIAFFIGMPYKSINHPFVVIPPISR